MLEVVRVRDIPSQLLGVAVVIHIVEILLCILPKEIIYLIKTAGRQVEEGLLQGLIHTVVHQEFLDTGVDLGHLAVVFLEQLFLRLVGVDAVMHQHLMHLADGGCERERGNDEVRVLKYAQLGVEGEALLLQEGFAEQLIPHVGGGTLQDLVGIGALGYDGALVEDLAVIALDDTLEACLTVVIYVVLGDSDVQPVLYREVLQLFNEGRLDEVVGVEEQDELAARSVEALVTCDGRACVGLGDDADTAVLVMIFL